VASNILPRPTVPPTSERPLSLTDQIHERMREEILTATWQPGDLVLETDLSVRYGVSKTPVREALRLLSQEGWIVTLPRKGYLVRPLRLQDVKEVFELRLLLEPGLFVQAMRVNRGTTETLRGIADAERRSGRIDDSAHSVGRGFHISAVTLAGNERALTQITGLLDEVRRLHNLMPELETHGPADHISDDHTRIVELMAAGDAAEVYNLVRTHIQASASRLMSAFRLNVD